MSYYKDFRHYLQALEQNDKLFRISRTIAKESELMPMIRLQFRGLPESERKGFLFENVTDVNGKEYEAKIAVAVYAGSRDIYALGMGCKPDQIQERWTEAQLHPIEPKMVSSGPCQEVVCTGDELLQDGHGLDSIPFPVELPGFSGQIRTTTHFSSKDPETGIRNCGIYSCHLVGRKEMLWETGEQQHAFIHWKKNFEKGRPLEGAVVVGALPSVIYSAASKVAYGVDEYAVAGGIAGEPIDLVKCKTVDVDVPASAEMIIEGKVSIEYEQEVPPFGEYTGYFALDRPFVPLFNVTAVTFRRNPIFTTIISQFPPSESSKMRQHGFENNFFKFLKYDCGLRGVKDVAFHEMAQDKLIVICMKKLIESHAWQALNAAVSFGPEVGKIIIAVDEDIDPHDMDSVLWALSFRMQPHRDIRITRGKTVGLDPSGSPPETPYSRKYYPEYMGASSILIDTTLKWPYPPVALPKKEYMENALKIWEEEKLPKLNLKKPWFGYELGDWSEENRRFADYVVRGKHYELGKEILKNLRKISSKDVLK